MALFVTFVIDGTIGVILVYTLVIALLASLIMTLAVRRSISAVPTLGSSAVSKGDSLVLEVRLSNSSFLPSPAVRIETDCSEHLSRESDGTVSGSVSGKGVNSLKFGFTAVHSGRAHITVKSVRLTDYLGIFSFTIKLPDDQNELFCAIYPDIPDAALQTSIVRTSSQFTSADDDEEESEETSPVPTGIAGYDHREYTPGDPIKRINWKASSKRNILLVRLDEKIKGAGRTFLLDCPETPVNDVSLTVRDNVIEGALAMLVTLLHEGRDAVFCYRKQGMWLSAEIHALQDVILLQQELSDYEPSDEGGAIPPEKVSGAKTLICFTSAVKDYSHSAREIVSSRPDTMLITSYASALPQIASDQWTLSADFTLSRM